MKVRITKCNTSQKLPIVLYISRVKLQAQILTYSAPTKALNFLFSITLRNSHPDILRAVMPLNMLLILLQFLEICCECL
jgi:hypothetical protein